VNTYSYLIYGLLLQANQCYGALPEILATRTPDVTLHFGSIPRWRDFSAQAVLRYTSPYQDQDGRPNLRIWHLAGCGFHLEFRDQTEFYVDDTAGHVWARWPAQYTAEDAWWYVVGPVMSFILQLKGFVCFHGSAVVIGDHALALTGGSGAGKSTAAACFAQRGFPVLTEDLVPLRQDQDGFYVQPGYPRLRLWPDAIRSLGLNEANLPLMDNASDKRVLDLDGTRYPFAQEQKRLSAVYMFMDRTDDPAAPYVTALQSFNPIIALLRNVYGIHLTNDVEGRAAQFNAVTAIVPTIRIREVHPSSDISRLERLCDAILDDFAREISMAAMTD
jgi:hypothetical protein